MSNCGYISAVLCQAQEQPDAALPYAAQSRCSPALFAFCLGSKYGSWATWGG